LLTKDTQSLVEELKAKLKKAKMDGLKLRDQLNSHPKKQKRLKTSGSTYNHKLSNSIESLSFSKKQAEKGPDRLVKDFKHPSKLSSSLDKRKTGNFGLSFEKKAFDTLKMSKGFEKHLLANFKELYALQKTREGPSHVHALYSTIYPVLIYSSRRSNRTRISKTPFQRL
jgi:hypothetical protein